MIITTLAVVLICVLASVALAASTSQIITDASDGTIDGHYTIAEVRAALAVVRGDPTYSQYTDVESVLQDYLTTLEAVSSTPSPEPQSTATTTGTSGTTGATSSTGSTAATASGGDQLARTGGGMLLVFALGGVLLVAGVALRRRSA